MSKKKKTVGLAELSYSLKERILERYNRWKHIFDCGSSDPSWEDGVNINLVRNHIFYEKSQCEKALGDKFALYPDSYFYPDPVELPNDFMAVDRKLACAGKVLTANKNMCYNEAIKFDWKEVMT
jgi:hypothetical protein